MACVSIKKLSGNELKTKFKCKNYLQISILNPQLYRNVADLIFEDFSAFVLLFENRMKHPALRVILITILTWLRAFVLEIYKISQKLNFSFFFSDCRGFHQSDGVPPEKGLSGTSYIYLSNSRPKLDTQSSWSILYE